MLLLDSMYSSKRCKKKAQQQNIIYRLWIIQQKTFTSVWDAVGSSLEISFQTSLDFKWNLLIYTNTNKANEQ